MDTEPGCPPGTRRVTLGVSSCLLGEAVRYDGGHKYNGYIVETLGRVFDFRPWCPEMAIGLGAPRPPIRLVVMAHETRARCADSAVHDVTQALEGYALDTAARLDDISGYLFKQGSPSCGMEGVPRHFPDGRPAGEAAGIYAGVLMSRCPELPAEEEGRLMDPVLRENFLERVFVYHRWQALRRGGLTAAGLVAFHTRHKFNLLAHDEPAYRTLGRLAARAGVGDIHDLGREYLHAMMAALKKPAHPGAHTNVLMHICGFFTGQLAADDKRELLGAIEDYRRGRVPLVVPVTLIRHHLRRHPNAYIERQYYLNPHPHELRLRSMV